MIALCRSSGPSSTKLDFQSYMHYDVWHDSNGNKIKLYYSDVREDVV